MYGDLKNDIAICISLGSFLIAALALWRTFKKDRKEKIQSRKALIRAIGFMSEVNTIVGIQTMWCIRIWNDGVATAKNIRIESDDIGKESRIVLMTEEDKFPYPILNSGDKFEIPISVYTEINTTPIIKLIWDDAYKKNNEIEQTLEF